MSRYLHGSRRRVTVYLGLLIVAGMAWTVGAQQQTPPANPSSNFTGGEVTTLMAEGRLSYYVFAPGARTKWHAHQGGQLILAEEGRRPSAESGARQSGSCVLESRRGRLPVRRTGTARRRMHRRSCIKSAGAKPPGWKRFVTRTSGRRQSDRGSLSASASRAVQVPAGATAFSACCTANAPSAIAARPPSTIPPQIEEHVNHPLVALHLHGHPGVL